MNYLKDNKAVAQFVEDTLPLINDRSQLIMIIRPEKSGGYSVTHVTEKLSEGIIWQRWAPSEVLSRISQQNTPVG